MKSKITSGYKKVKYYVYKETLVDGVEHFWSFLGAFLGIGIIAYLQSGLPKEDQIFLIGSFGASSVLIYGAINSPLAQPRNLIGGHFFSAIIGIIIQKYVPDIIWLQAPLAVASSIVIMQITKTLHPPGGATALIAVTGSEQLKSLGFYYVIYPVLSGALILFAVALIFNNITSKRMYPSAGSKFSTSFKTMIEPSKRKVKRLLNSTKEDE